MEAAMDLMRRISPKESETALSALLSLLPHHSADLLSQVDLPLQVLPSRLSSFSDSRCPVPSWYLCTSPSHLAVRFPSYLSIWSLVLLVDPCAYRWDLFKWLLPLPFGFFSSWGSFFSSFFSFFSCLDFSLCRLGFHLESHIHRMLRQNMISFGKSTTNTWLYDNFSRISSSVSWYLNVSFIILSINRPLFSFLFSLFGSFRVTNRDLLYAMFASHHQSWQSWCMKKRQVELNHIF